MTLNKKTTYRGMIKNFKVDTLHTELSFDFVEQSTQETSRFVIEQIEAYHYQACTTAQANTDTDHTIYIGCDGDSKEHPLSYKLVQGKRTLMRFAPNVLIMAWGLSFFVQAKQLCIGDKCYTLANKATLS